MELDQFITQTLVAITDGVQNAITAIHDKKGLINPCWGDTKDIGQQLVQDVNFDIAVTVSDKTNLSASGGIKVVGVMLGADGAKAAESSHISRIQFKIPIVPPTTVVPD